jgi:hypothetical protein
MAFHKSIIFICGYIQPGDVIMSITYNKGERKYGKRGGAIRHFFSFIVFIFLALIYYSTASQAKPAVDSLRIIYGGNLLGTVKPCG